MEKEKNMFVGKSMNDLTSVSVSLGFKDDTGVILPLTDYQAARLVQFLGIRLNPETGALSFFTDKQLDAMIKGAVLNNETEAKTSK